MRRPAQRHHIGGGYRGPAHRRPHAAPSPAPFVRPLARRKSRRPTRRAACSPRTRTAAVRRPGARSAKQVTPARGRRAPAQAAASTCHTALAGVGRHDDIHSSAADAPSPAHSRVRSVLGRLLASGSAAYQLMSSASNFPSRASHGCFSEKRFAETLSLRRLLSDASTFPQELDKELCGSPPALTRCVQGRAGLSPGLMNRSAMSGSDIPAILNAD